MKQYRKKLKERTLTSEDIEEIKKEIRKIIENEKDGHKELSQDDIEDLDIIKEFLSNYEQGETSVQYSIGGEDGLAPTKTGLIVQELDMNQIVSHANTYVGGNGRFRIVNRTQFRNYLYKKIESKLDKIPSSKGPLHRIKDFYINQDVGTIIGRIVTTAISTVVGGYILYLLTQSL